MHSEFSCFLVHFYPSQYLGMCCPFRQKSEHLVSDNRFFLWRIFCGFSGCSSNQSDVFFSRAATFLYWVFSQGSIPVRWLADLAGLVDGKIDPGQLATVVAVEKSYRTNHDSCWKFLPCQPATAVTGQVTRPVLVDVAGEYIQFRSKVPFHQYFGSLNIIMFLFGKNCYSSGLCGCG